MENPLYRSKSHFSGQNMAKFGPRKTLVSTNVGPLLEIGTYPPWLSGGLGFVNMILKIKDLVMVALFFSNFVMLLK
jgi:hypothetical protein